MNLVHEYYKATEYQLATLESILQRESTPKAAIDRQYEIGFRMMMVCARLDPTPTGENIRVQNIWTSENPLREYRAWAIGSCVEKHREFVASLPYGGYNERESI